MSMSESLAFGLRSILTVAACLAAGAVSAQSAPRAPDGHPDLNGLWQAFVTANIDLQDHEAQASSGRHQHLGGGCADQAVHQQHRIVGHRLDRL